MRNKMDNTKEINELDLQEVARLGIEGNTSGILDSEGYCITWELKMNKFEN